MGVDRIEKDRGLRKPLQAFLVILVLTGLCALLLVPMTFQGITIRRVDFPNNYSRGENVSGLLLLPSEPPGGPLPAVVFAGGITTRKEMYLSLYRDFARRGMAVLAVDLPGHGDSGGHCTFGGSEYTALLAACDWLTRGGAGEVDIDADRVAVVGHSLGGISAVRAAVFQPRPMFRAVAAVYCWQDALSAVEHVSGPAEKLASRFLRLTVLSRYYRTDDTSAEGQRSVLSYVDEATPPNFLLVIGSLDELASTAYEKELISRAAGGEGVAEGKVYGSFEEGTARKLAVTFDDHITEMFSMQVFSEVYTWLCRSLDIKKVGTSPFPYFRVFFWVLVVDGCLALAALLLVILYRALGERVRVTGGGTAAMAAAGDASLPAVLFFLLSAALAFPMALYLKIDLRVPFLGGDVLGAFALNRVLLLGLGALFFLWREGEGLREAFGRARAAGTSTAWSLVPPLGAIILLLVLYAPLARFLYLGEGLPYSWGWFAAFAALMTAVFWAEGGFLHRFFLPRYQDLLEEDGRKARLRYYAAEAGLRAASFAAAYLPFILDNPWHIMGRPGHLRLPVLLLAFLAVFPFYYFLSWMNLHFRRKGTSLLLPSLTMGLLFAWFLTTTVCTH